MESTKIQEFDLDPNCGFAKEETAQAILGAVGNGVVKSVQRGVFTYGAKNLTGTATISAVNVDKAIILHSSIATDSSGSQEAPGVWDSTAQFSNATTLLFTRADYYYSSERNAKVAYQVIEFY